MTQTPLVRNNQRGTNVSIIAYRYCHETNSMTFAEFIVFCECVAIAPALTNCLRGSLPAIRLRAVCLVRAMEDTK